MNFTIPFGFLLSFALLVGCTSSPQTASVTDASACASCASGEKCADCASKATACVSCAAGEKCADCAAGETKEACPTCASGEACASCAGKTDPAAEAEPVAAAEPVAVIDAKGMGCPLCASNIDRRMQKLDGVTWTKIDLGKGEVIVGLDPNESTPTAQELQDAVNDAGYTAGDVTLPSNEVTP